MPDADAPHLFDLTPDELAGHVADWGMPRFRAKQVMQWVFRRGVADPAEMMNIPARERALLSERLVIVRGYPLRHQVATDGTQKLLIDWSADEPPVTAESGGANGRLTVLNTTPTATDRQTECVMIPAHSRSARGDERWRRTACVSSQAGCAVGCRFCASGLGGLTGNLTAGQIVQQAWQLGHLSPAAGMPDDAAGPVTNVVFMGMGEPLSNFAQVTRAIRLMIAHWGLALSGRRITVSTVGLPAQIRRLAELDIPVTLAISLHAPNDDIRRSIIPWAEFVAIDDLIAAGRVYFERTGREVTLEYILLRGVNDRPEHARELAGVAGRLRANVNLIRYNEVAGLAYGRPGDEDVRRFQAILRGRGVNSHIRASRGRDIAAACGQLRHEQVAGV